MENLLHNQTPISPLTTVDARQDFSSNKKKITIGVLLALIIVGLIFYFSKTREGPTVLSPEERASLIESIKKEAQPVLTQAQKADLIESMKLESANSTVLTDESRSNLIDQIKNIK